MLPMPPVRHLVLLRHVQFGLNEYSQCLGNVQYLTGARP